MNWIKTVTFLLLIITLMGCINTGRYHMKNDQAPLRKPTSLELDDATPEYLRIYPQSIKPYVVLGKSYTPLKTAKNYLDEGIASWYGRKFHGHLTANGEIYDMFAMSAAHKTLPIPSFVRVTNITNKKSIVVRVNDRGPFHDDRVIDLSYTAAFALDMLKTGTAQVSLQSIVIEQNPPPEDPIEVSIEAVEPIKVSAPAQQTQPLVPIDRLLFVQVVASSDGAKITQTANRLSALFEHPRQIPRENGIYKLRFGPLQDIQQARDLISTLKNNGYPSAYVLYTGRALPHN